MIDKKILNEVLPLPELDDLKEEYITKLKNNGFSITNFNSGGVFYTLLMIVLQCRIDLIKLLRLILNNMFISHADAPWLELKATDFSKKRKQPLKTRGLVTVSRTTVGDAIKILKGQVFKTALDINGEELKFVVLEDTILPQNSLSIAVPVEAEYEGSRYNVPEGQITRALTHIEGIDTITNTADWIIREGSDLEDMESLRNRVLGSWAELSSMPIADKYKNVCEAVQGVLYVTVDDQHPRGQGTIDIIVTSTAGAASEELLALVRKEAESIKAPYDNLLVKSSTTVTQNISVSVTVEYGINTDDLENDIKAALISMMAINKSRSLNEITHADIVYWIKLKVSGVKNVKVLLPTNDVFLQEGTVILLGTVNVSIQEV